MKYRRGFFVACPSLVRGSPATRWQEFKPGVRRLYCKCNLSPRHSSILPFVIGEMRTVRQRCRQRDHRGHPLVIRVQRENIFSSSSFFFPSVAFESNRGTHIFHFFDWLVERIYCFDLFSMLFKFLLKFCYSKGRYWFRLLESFVLMKRLCVGLILKLLLIILMVLGEFILKIKFVL